MFIKSKVEVNEKDMECCRQFAETIYWQQECEEIFDGAFSLDLPYAPPGMYQHLGKNELKWHYDWLSHTVGNDWKWENTKALGTDHEGIFWVFRTGSGSVCWGGKEGWYESKFATLLHIQDGRITYAKDHFDPAGFYKAIGIELPKFCYDAKSPEQFQERAKPSQAPCTEESSICFASLMAV